MKKLLILSAIVLLVSCNQKKLDRMQAVQDSLQQVAETKDSAISDFIGTMNEIQSNLDSIKALQEIVDIQSKSNTEPQATKRQKMLRDIALINELLQKNRELVLSQQKKMNYSTYKMKEMQEMLNLMSNQLESKDTEIVTLQAELEKLQLNISDLNQDLMAAQQRTQEQEKLLEEKTSTIDQKVSALNTAYYVFGTAKELIENGIIEKEGGFLGIGRSLKFRKDFNPDLFTEINIREVDEIALNSKKAKVITTHPAASYELTGEDVVEKLVISDPDLFWETNKYLVIVVN
ncbi:Cbp1 family collagen-binding glycoprotein adhesin [Sunxiuqinia sp. sy24]|uniref:Cbp1 family collagen-binding glycoprotein adhesin n=1 Tax=Sunxiuqinia sp. sy24 TaxID=3461495 RepID=UPI0040459BAE